MNKFLLEGGIISGIDPDIYEAQKACNLKTSWISNCSYHLKDRERIFKEIMQLEEVYVYKLNAPVDDLRCYMLILYQKEDFLCEEKYLEKILKSKDLTIQLAEWLRDALQLNLYVIETYKGMLFKRKIGVKYKIVLQSEYNVQSINPF